ncbi:MAG: DUF928 domain-containing protein [Rivularia sp. (in: cyanobacteria)]
MKRTIFASTLGFALIASAAWIPSQKVRAVSFSSPEDSTPQKATGGASRTIFQSGSAPERARGGASRTIFQSGSAPERDRGGASRTIFQSGTAPERARGGASRTIFQSGTAPERARGGASRDGRRYLSYPDNTVEQPAAILALLPQSYFGTTVSQRAEIFVYVPVSAAREGAFSLKDAEGNTLHEMNIPISGKAEVISIKVPTELKIEKEYKWFLALKVDGQLTTRTPYVDGWIKRVRPNQEIAASMQQNDLLKQAEAFAKHGVWYDCVATLAKLRATQPNNANLDREWLELLESVGLQQIKKAPIVASNIGF